MSMQVQMATLLARLGSSLVPPVVCKVVCAADEKAKPLGLGFSATYRLQPGQPI